MRRRHFPQQLVDQLWAARPSNVPGDRVGSAGFVREHFVEDVRDGAMIARDRNADRAGHRFERLASGAAGARGLYRLQNVLRLLKLVQHERVTLVERPNVAEFVKFIMLPR